MKRLVPLLLLLLSAPGACDRKQGAPDPEPTISASAVPAPAAIGSKAPLDESCQGRYHDIRIVARILNEKGEAQPSKPMLMTALNMQGLGEITDRKGVHVDQGFTDFVNSTYVMCLVIERNTGDPFTYHIRLRFRIQTNANGWAVQCSVYDPAYGLGMMDLAQQISVIKTTEKKVVAAEVVCERKYPI